MYTIICLPGFFQDKFRYIERAEDCEEIFILMKKKDHCQAFTERHCKISDWSVRCFLIKSQVQKNMIKRCGKKDEEVAQATCRSQQY